MSQTIRYGNRSNQTTFRSHTPLSNDQIARYAPSVLADEAHHTRGERYGFIPTINVIEGLRAEGFQPFEVRQTKTRLADRVEHTKHLVRLRHADVSGDNREVPEIVLINSHDGTSSYQLIGGIFRYVCSNGLICGDNLQQIRVRHTGNVIDNVIEGSFRVLDDLKLVNDHVDQYKSIELSQPEQTIFANAALQLRWDDGKAPVSDDGVLRIRRFDDRRNDLWTVFNRVQENLIKGGLHGRGTTGKRTTTREVGGVNENVKLNRALWSLADGLAQLKTGQVTLEEALA